MEAGRFGKVSTMKLNGGIGCRMSGLALGLVAGLLPLTGKALPDLVVNLQRAQATVEYQRRAFSQSDCAFSEGCVRGMGGRRLWFLEGGGRKRGRGKGGGGKGRWEKGGWGKQNAGA